MPGFVQIGPANENIGAVSAGANINGGDDQFAPYQGTAATTFSTMATMRSRLLALGGVFTTGYVDQLTFNDMVYALKISGG